MPYVSGSDVLHRFKEHQVSGSNVKRDSCDHNQIQSRELALWMKLFCVNLNKPSCGLDFLEIYVKFIVNAFVKRCILNHFLFVFNVLTLLFTLCIVSVTIT